MADTSITISQGTGTSIDTRTESTNGNHRQVVVLGDPATNAGVAPVDATTGLKVDLGTDNDIQGTVAHDGADSGNPIKVGGKATTSMSGTTAVSNADRTDALFDTQGAQLMRPYASLEDIVSGVSTVTDGSSTSTISAQGSGVKVYVTSVIIANSSSTNVTVDIRDGAAGTVKATFPVPANGGVVHAFTVPLGFSANTAICADPSASASSIVTTLVGFKSKI